MLNLEKISYNKIILIDDNYCYEGLYQRVYLEKTFHKFNNRDQYFLKLYYHTPQKEFVCQGYIYFYIDWLTKTSSFIGTYIKPEYRGCGLSSLLISNWIKLCFDNDIYNLNTNKTQRKPFLLYLLKKYYFEILDPAMYDYSKYTINICKKENDKSKYIHFRNLQQKEAFLKSSIMKEDNYSVLDQITDNITILDQVILSKPYLLEDENSAYNKSIRYIKTKK